MLRRAIDTRLEWLLLVSVAVLMVGGPARLYGQSAGEPDIAPLWIKKDTFGTVNASVGDLNADGFDDAAILGTERGSNRDGPVCILFGSPHGLEDNCEQSVNPPPTSVDSVAGLGDVNGDGHADIIVGAPDQAGGTNTGAGAVYTYFGNDNGISSSYEWTTSGPSTDSNYFGRAVAGAGDVDGDGYDDVLVGDPGFLTPQLCLEKNGPGNGGGIWLYRGSADGPTKPAAWSFSWRDKPSRRGACLGYTVNGVGDINDDGYDDVVVAAPLWRNASGNAVGKVFGFYGSPDGLSETPDWSLVHPGTTSDGDVWGNLPLEGILGWSISDGGDINGDGIDDLVVGGRGAYENDTTDGGDQPLMTKYFIFEGSSASLSDSPDDVLSRLGGDHLLPASSGNGGTEFSLGGDENQDGYDDLMVPGTTASRFPSAAPLNTHWVIHYGSASGLDHSVGVKIHKNMFPDSPSGSWGYITQAELDGNFNGSGGADPMAFISRETPNFPRSSTGLHVFTAGKNPPPAADDQAVMVGRSESLQISFQASDPYDDPLSYEVTSPPQAGSLSSLETDAGTVTYQAPEDFAGPDPFNFTVTDSYDRNTTATIEVTVTNGAPVFNEPPAGATYTTRVGDRLTVPVDVTDPEGDNLTKRSPQFPDGTSIRWEDGEVRWTPDADQTGEYTLVLEADDGFDTTTREVSMTVNPAAGDTGPCSGPGADTQDRCPPGMDAGSTDGHNPADSTGSSGCTCSAGEGQTVSRGLIVACLSITLMLIRLRTRSVSTT